MTEDEKIAAEIAKLLGMTVMHHRDIDKKRFNDVIKELKKIIRENAKADLKTFLYLQFGGHAVVDSKGLT